MRTHALAAALLMTLALPAASAAECVQEQGLRICALDSNADGTPDGAAASHAGNAAGVQDSSRDGVPETPYVVTPALVAVVADTDRDGLHDAVILGSSGTGQGTLLVFARNVEAGAVPGVLVAAATPGSSPLGANSAVGELVCYASASAGCVAPGGWMLIRTSQGGSWNLYVYNSEASRGADLFLLAQGRDTPLGNTGWASNPEAQLQCYDNNEDQTCDSLLGGTRTTLVGTGSAVTSVYRHSADGRTRWTTLNGNAGTDASSPVGANRVGAGGFCTDRGLDDSCEDLSLAASANAGGLAAAAGAPHSGYVGGGVRSDAAGARLCTYDGPSDYTPACVPLA